MITAGKGAMPLYIQIRELLIAKISKGDWLPGDSIPSEMNLSQELGVSQGTVRKAITELVEYNVLRRKQGRGTFVSNHDSQRALFHFFHVVDVNGHKVMPDSKVLRCHRKHASHGEALKLKLKDRADIIRIERVRNLSSSPTMIETITLPGHLFKDWDELDSGNLPNMLYELYEKQFGITIHSAEERLRAVAATKHDASLLNLEAGTPLLEIERVALTLNKSPVELRISRCNTKKHHYENTIL